MKRPSLLLTACVAAGLPSLAAARNEKALGYAPDAVWSPVVRFVRVDENLKILEKDAEAGYVLFELRQDKKTFRGSVEIIASKDHGVRLVIDIQDRPSYVELAMLARLERKLTTELGPAPSPPKKPGRESPPAPADKPKEPGVQEAPTQPIPEA
ncbi:MAG: hypothetical protein R3B48_06260 [Kofleriaceae bacterium]